MSTVNIELWKLMDEIRGSSYRLDITEIIQMAKQRGIKVDYPTLRHLSHTWRDIGEYFLPENITDFIISLLEDLTPKFILDTWCDTGSLLSPLVEFFNPKKSVGITPNQSSCKIAQLLASREDVVWNLGDPFRVIDNISGDFDLIASVPPFGMKGKVPFADEVGLKDNLGNLLILKACQKLNKNGTGAFVVPPSFFFEERTNSVKNSLNQHGLYLDAAFMLPSGTLEPLTSIDTYLIIIKRSKVKELFVGQMFGSKQQDALLLKNYHARKAGKIPQQGVLINENDFKGFNSVIFNYELEQMVTRSNLNTLPLNSVAVAINLPKQSSTVMFTDDVNAVYLPLVGKSPSVTSIEDLSIKPQNCAQIVFDENKAFAPYVAKFFNSRLGLKLRESLSSGAVIPKITKSSLEASSIYLPDLKIQKEVSRINFDITNLSSELDSLQNELWEFPNRKTKIEGKLRRFSQEKGWELWIEELPFPMASILWAYLATVEPKDKLEHLSHFFEASIQFLATICLSAIAQDKEYYKLNQKEWNTENPKYKGWYKNAGFGNWLSLQYSLAKFIRGLLSNESTKNRCLSLFGNASEQFIQTICGKRLLGVFDEAHKYRNLWIGHRGRLSEEEAKKRVAVFENLLSRLREVLGDTFTQISLLSPKTSEYADGIFQYKVKSIKGTRTEFREEVILSIKPLDIRKLYILPELQINPIEVLPFGKLMSSPATTQNAFYFYSRFDNDGVRWVSYHFEKEADLTVPDPEVVNLMKELFDGEIQR